MIPVEDPTRTVGCWQVCATCQNSLSQFNTFISSQITFSVIQTFILGTNKHEWEGVNCYSSLIAFVQRSPWQHAFKFQDCGLCSYPGIGGLASENNTFTKHDTFEDGLKMNTK